MGKGVHREMESEGSPMQNQVVMYKNRIVGLRSWVTDLGIGKPNSRLEATGVNPAEPDESNVSYPGRSLSRKIRRSQQRA